MVTLLPSWITWLPEGHPATNGDRDRSLPGAPNPPIASWKFLVDFAVKQCLFLLVQSQYAGNIRDPCSWVIATPSVLARITPITTINGHHISNISNDIRICWPLKLPSTMVKTASTNNTVLPGEPPFHPCRTCWWIPETVGHHRMGPSTHANAETYQMASGDSQENHKKSIHIKCSTLFNYIQSENDNIVTDTWVVKWCSNCNLTQFSS